MGRSEQVAIFWDYENCHPPASMPGYTVADKILDVARSYGAVNVFKAYFELSTQSLKSKAPTLHSELQCSGVSLIHCPHNGRKDVADKMMLVDMMAYAIDHAASATIILISGDRDFTYGVSVLKLRGYHVVSISPVSGHSSLKSRATDCFYWEDILRGISSPPPKPSGQVTPMVAAASCLAMTEQAAITSDEDEIVMVASKSFPDVTPPIVPCKASSASIESAAVAPLPMRSSAIEKDRYDQLLSSESLAESWEVLNFDDHVAVPSSSPSTSWKESCSSSSPIMDDLSQDILGTASSNDAAVADMAVLASQSLRDNSPSLRPTASEFIPGGLVECPRGDLAGAPSNPPTPCSQASIPLEITNVFDELCSQDGGCRSVEKPDPHSLTYEQPAMHSVPSVFHHAEDMRTDFPFVPTPSLPSEYSFPGRSAGEAGVLDSQAINRSSGSTPKSVMGVEQTSAAEASIPSDAFDLLIKVLLRQRAEGVIRPRWSQVGVEIMGRNPQAYKRAGVTKLKRYLQLAQDLKLVKLGGLSNLGDEWVELETALCGDPVFVVPPHFQSPFQVLSQQADPSKATSAMSQNRLPLSLSANYPVLAGPNLQNGVSVHVLSDDFSLLIDILRRLPIANGTGKRRMQMSQVGTELMRRDPRIYERTGVTKLKDYLIRAREAKVISATIDSHGHGWIELIDNHPDPDITPFSVDNLTGTLSVVNKPAISRQETGNRLDISVFDVLIECLLQFRSEGITQASWSTVAIDIWKRSSQPYQRAGVNRLKDYLCLAREANVVTLGGLESTTQWVELNPASLSPSTKTDSIDISRSGPEATMMMAHDPIFTPLVQTIVLMPMQGNIHRYLWSAVGEQLLKRFPNVYKAPGMSSFRAYLAKAEEAGVVSLGEGPAPGQEWVELRRA